MKLATLKALLAARSSGVPAVLITRLDDGRQVLFSKHDDPLVGEWEPLESACSQVLSTDQGRTIEHGGHRYFIQAHNPCKRLFIVGAVHICQRLVPMAIMAGYAVTVIDPRDAWATPERFPGIAMIRTWPNEALGEAKLDGRSAVVTLSHDSKLDDPALEHAIRSDAFYVGALGGRKTHGKRVERLAEKGFTAAEISRIHAPVGLDIGAVSPSEIAISIMAELTQVLRLHGPRRESSEENLKTRSHPL